MEESSDKGSNRLHKEPCREDRQGLSKIVGSKRDPDKDQGGVWANRPTPETVQRLIEWLSDEIK